MATVSRNWMLLSCACKPLSYQLIGNVGMAHRIFGCLETVNGRRSPTIPGRPEQQGFRRSSGRSSIETYLVSAIAWDLCQRSNWNKAGKSRLLDHTCKSDGTLQIFCGYMKHPFVHVSYLWSRFFGIGVWDHLGRCTSGGYISEVCCSENSPEKASTKEVEYL